MQGLDHVAENILSFLDAKSLCAAGAVSKEWARVISEGMLWKKLIERKVNTDSLWKGLADRRNWIQYLFKPKPGESHPPHSFYRGLYPSIIKDIDVSPTREILLPSQWVMSTFLCRPSRTTGGAGSTTSRG